MRACVTGCADRTRSNYSLPVSDSPLRQERLDWAQPKSCGFTGGTFLDCRQDSNAFGCGVNDLPLTLILSWYEQKAVSVLLTLLHLGIKNIKIGPSLPAFITPNVLAILVENYAIAPISTPEQDLAFAR